MSCKTRGIMTGESIELSVQSTRGILGRGGTILGTSRTNPFKDGGDGAEVFATLARDGVDALVAIGGDDTLGVAAKLGDAIATQGEDPLVLEDLDPNRTIMAVPILAVDRTRLGTVILEYSKDIFRPRFLDTLQRAAMDAE